MGEGAGYAGGIMSAALDGAETAILCMAKIRKTKLVGIYCEVNYSIGSYWYRNIVVSV